MPRTARTARFLGLVLLAGAGLAPSLAAEPGRTAPRLPCHSYAEIAKQLGNRYGEQPVSVGLQTNGNLLQVFTSKDSGSWTILSMAPNGVACIVAAGKSWEALPVRSTDPEA